ncbi:MAG: tRNA (adenosine(37)-N6)-threonylcarbamoyltransferase complex transferase subunit TsaD [Bacillota bacterium]|nr:MAG: tRNA (adenosine(37)-N6)-threonylcarbamoyltransferase complex transferase subunit TsaD [Bacillota bacterium]
MCLALGGAGDETAAAVVADGRRVLSSVVASQRDLHRRYGGVVPELASRRHLETFLPVLQEALEEAGVRPPDIDLVAVTRGPGLLGSLMVGLMAAKTLAYVYRRPLVGVHHLAGHVYACFLEAGEPPWPAVGLIVSGGHTELVLLPGDGRVLRLGGTRDDAAGEAFDKVARLLDLPYPGGPQIDRLARQGDPTAFAFPRAMLGDGTYDFSFSGLKTAVALEVQALRARGGDLPVADLCASFQQAVVDVLAAKTLEAAARYRAASVLLAGGVAANRALRRALEEGARRLGVELRVPPPEYCTDNAAMIAAAGTYAYRAGRVDNLDLEAAARLPLERL